MPAALWGIGVAAAVALGLYAKPLVPRGMGGAAMRNALPRVAGPPPDFSRLLFLLGVGSVLWYAAAVAMPLLVLAARHVGVERQSRWRAIGISVGVVAALVAFTTVGQYVVTYRQAALRPPFLAYLLQALGQHVLTWVAVVGIVAAIEAGRRAVHAALDRERLRAQIAEQQLTALTGQLHPHFLFNTLQSISTLIHRDPEAADEMLAKLSDLLRELLRHRESALVPLEDELRFARTYLEIAQLRFADRLQFEIDVAPSVGRAAVPLFILQPLVENALAHGIGGQARGGRVTVRACREADRLRLEVTDDGAGLTSDATVREGIGLGNTRERLRASFGADHQFALASGTAGGAVARIDIPFRLHAGAEAS